MTGIFIALETQQKYWWRNILVKKSIAATANDATALAEKIIDRSMTN